MSNRTNYTSAQGVLTLESPLRQVWPAGLVALRVYRGLRVFDPELGKIETEGESYALDLSAEHPAVVEQLALLMATRWRWQYAQAALLLAADGELPIGAEHFSGTVFSGSQLQQT